MSAAQDVTVVLDGREAPVTVRADNRDYVAWDMVAPQKKWPGLQEAPLLFQTYVAWHALKRCGEYTGDFDAFRVNDCVSVEVAQVVQADPTPPAPGAG